METPKASEMKKEKVVFLEVPIVPDHLRKGTISQMELQPPPDPSDPPVTATQLQAAAVFDRLLGGSKSARASTVAMLHKLAMMENGNTNLLQQMPQGPTSLEGNESCMQEGFLPIGRYSVTQQFEAALLSLSLPMDEIESQLEVEEGMWLFCSLFPEHYEFDKETIVQLWRAIGATDHIGNLYFEILLSSGYILLSRKCFPHQKHKYKLNFPRWWRESYRDLHKFQHKFLCGDDIDEEVLRKMTHLKDLKSLVVCKDAASRIKKIPSDVFSCLSHLEILDLSRTLIARLPYSIGYLVDLRYLDLSHTQIESLPETVDCLSKLQTLKLNDCRRLSRLPLGFRKLISLVHLEFDVLGQLAVMPRGMGSLVNIETLSAFLVDRYEGRTIKELKNVNKLKGHFCISRLEKVTSPSEAEEASLSRKICVKELELRWRDDEGNHDVEILRRLQPNSNLEQLDISCYGGLEFPSWIGDPSFEKITSIILFKCENSKRLPSLGKLPSLKLLSLIDMSSVKEIADEFRGGSSDNQIAFPKLESLDIIGFLELEIWKEPMKGDYPCLCKLVIKRCPNLKAIPSSLFRVPTLQYLEVIHCKSLTSLPDFSTSLTTLIIVGCPSITMWFQKCKVGERLNIKNMWIDHKKMEANSRITEVAGDREH